MEPQATPALTMEQFSALIAGAIGETVKQLGLDRVDAKHGVFPGVDEKEALAKTKNQRLADWLRAKYMKDWTKQTELEKTFTTKAALTGLTTSGLGFVPEEFRTEVIRVAEQFGLVRRLATVFPTSLQTINLSMANGEITFTWTSYGSALTQSVPTYTEPVITIAGGGAITAIYKQLFMDATFPLIPHLAQLYGEATAGAEDSQGLVGTGSPFHGLIGGTISGQVTVTSLSNSYKLFTADDYLDLAMGVTAKYREGGAYFMHPTVFSYVRRLKDDNNAYIFQQPVAPGTPGTLWGYPVYESEKCNATDAVATKFVGFANPKRLYFADRQELEMDVSDQATLTTAGNLWEQHMVAVKGYERVGMLWTLGAGTSVLKTAAA